MAKEFIRIEKKDIERRSGLYKIIHRDTQNTYIGMSSGDMRSQIYSRLAPGAIERNKEKYRLEEAVSMHKESAFDIFVWYLNDTKQNLQKMLNVLIDAEKPSLNAYAHPVADEPYSPPPKPQLTITAAQTENLKASIAGVKDFFIKNTPDYSEVYQLLVFMLMHPDQDVESHIQNIGNEFLTPAGVTKTFKNGVVFLATGKMMRWNENDSIQGMGNQQFLSWMVNLMNNRDLIEYSGNEELKNCFAELCSWLIEKGKNTYINGFDFSFESDEYIIYDKHDWRIQERTNRSGNKGLIIFDKDGKGNLSVENIPTINPVIR